MVLWFLSLATAVGTGWLVFSRAAAGPTLHAAFLLSVCGFVACCLWALARGLSPDQDAPADRGGAAGGDQTMDDPEPR